MFLNPHQLACMLHMLIGRRTPERKRERSRVGTGLNLPVKMPIPVARVIGIMFLEKCIVRGDGWRGTEVGCHT